MRIPLVVLLGSLALAAPAGAVSGGHSLDIATAPYVAWLPQGCTGTLIAPDRVLTAGHCLDDFPASDVSVIVGQDGNVLNGGRANRFTTAREHGIPAAGFSVHPKFKESFPFAHKSPSNAIALNDVGIVVLKQPVIGVTPIRLSTGAGVEKAGENASIFGYGLTKPTDFNGPKTLQAGDMRVISAGDCEKAYPKAVIASELCAEDFANAKAPFITACGGDSGGPFVLQTPGGPMQIGVTSWGPEVKDAKCGREHLPGVYTRVSSFLSFINDPSPVIEPFPVDTSVDFPHVTGKAKVGETLTCNPGRYGGSPAKLSYKWVWKNKTISTKKTAKAIKSMRGHSVGCSITARNAGGHWTDFAPRIGRIVIR